MKKTFILLSIFLTSIHVFSFQSIQLIDMQTAGLLNKNIFIIDVKNFSPNSLLFNFQYSPFNRIQVGLSSGAVNLIGSDSPSLNIPIVGLQLKVRPLEEGIYNPAIVLGVNTQGYGPIITNNYDYKRYLYQSDGAYVSLSKSYMLSMFLLGLHGEVNYSFETKNLPFILDGLNYSVGIDFGLLSNLYILSEYNLRLNEEKSNDGILNFGLRWVILNNFYATFHVKDILGTNKYLQYSQDMLDREIRLTYLNKF